MWSGCVLHTTSDLCSAAAMHGLSCRTCLGKEPKPDNTNINKISPRNQGQEVSVPRAIAWTAAGLAPSGVVPTPCWPQPLVSLLGLVHQPPALSYSLTCHQMFIFRAHHAQRLIYAQPHAAQELAPGCLRGFEAEEESSYSASNPQPQMGGMSPLTSSAFGPEAQFRLRSSIFKT